MAVLIIIRVYGDKKFISSVIFDLPLTYTLIGSSSLEYGMVHRFQHNVCTAPGGWLLGTQSIAEEFDRHQLFLAFSFKIGITSWELR